MKAPLALAFLSTTIFVSALSAEEKVVFSDDFSDVKGFWLSRYDNQRDEGFDQTRDLTTFMDGESEGTFSITVTENHREKGPDGKTGVLSFAFDEVPKSSRFSGCSYMGRFFEGSVKIPGLKGASEDLKNVTLSFRYKAKREGISNPTVKYGFRLELNIDDAYTSRLQFEPLEAKGDWQAFTATLDKGDNKEAFLKAIAAEDAGLKFTFGQTGEITSYKKGDTLLIDDIKLTVKK